MPKKPSGAEKPDASKKKRRLLKIGAISAGCLLLTGALAVFGVDAYVAQTGARQILSPAEAEKLTDVDCILVLGCYVNENGVPSDMLADRLRRGVELQKAGVSSKLLMSGDHGREEYNEVEAMKQYAIDAGVASEDVFMDHAGFSTSESMYRAKEVFCAKKIVIVTQEYHLKRAIYAARALGLDAYGVAADYHRYRDQFPRDCREVLARVKDFGTAVFRPEPTFLGEPIPVSGNGDMTNAESVFKTK